MDLSERVAIVTGGGRGIGRAIALKLAEAGATVVINDVGDSTPAEGVAEEIRKTGRESLVVLADISQSTEVASLVDNTVEKYGKVDILVNNAGITRDQLIMRMSDDEWDAVLGINLKGVFLGCKLGIPALLRAGGGSIINTASFVALMGAATAQVAYTASKGGVVALTREIAAIYARQNIRANALCPGPVETPLLAKLVAEPAARARRLVHVPPGRFAQAEEVAQAALFLASDESAYVNGTAFVVDGGITATYITPE